MKVPFVDLARQYESIKPEIDEAIARVVKSQRFVKGPEKEAFEQEFADYLGVKYCVGVASGTDALFIALKALGISIDDQVYCKPETFIAAKEAIELCDAEWVPDPEFQNLDCAIMTHLYGIPHAGQWVDIPMIEDCAQAHGAEINGQKVGTFGDIGCFSFFPAKNLGAFGDAGAVVTGSYKLAEFMRMYADHGRKEKYKHEFPGINSRMDEIQAAVLRVKLPYLEWWNQHRRETAECYTAGLQDIVETPEVPEDCTPVWHLYVIKTDKRDELQEYLKSKDISTGIHYPYNLDGSENKDILSLPIFPFMTSEEIGYVIKHVKGFFK